MRTEGRRGGRTCPTPTRRPSRRPPDPPWNVGAVAGGGSRSRAWLAKSDLSVPPEQGADDRRDRGCGRSGVLSGTAVAEQRVRVAADELHDVREVPAHRVGRRRSRDGRRRSRDGRRDRDRRDRRGCRVGRPASAVTRRPAGIPATARTGARTRTGARARVAARSRAGARVRDGAGRRPARRPGTVSVARRSGPTRSRPRRSLPASCVTKGERARLSGPRRARGVGRRSQRPRRRCCGRRVVPRRAVRGDRFQGRFGRRIRSRACRGGDAGTRRGPVALAWPVVDGGGGEYTMGWSMKKIAVTRR